MARHVKLVDNRGGVVYVVVYVEISKCDPTSHKERASKGKGSYRRNPEEYSPYLPQFNTRVYIMRQCRRGIPMIDRRLIGGRKGRKEERSEWGEEKM